MNTASRIRELRLDRGLTQRQLAGKLGIDPITVSRWERGSHPPNDLNCVHLARVFGLPSRYFMNGEPEVAA